MTPTYECSVPDRDPEPPDDDEYQAWRAEQDAEAADYARDLKEDR